MRAGLFEALSKRLTFGGRRSSSVVSFWESLEERSFWREDPKWKIRKRRF